MRVLHVLHTSLPYACGYSYRSEQIIRNQKDAGVEVAVITSAQQLGAPVDEIRDGICYFRTGSPGLKRSPIRELQLMYALYRRIGEVSRSFKPEIIHAHSPVLVGMPAGRWARAHDIPFIYEIRDLWENASVDMGKFKAWSFRYRIAQMAENWVLRRADTVVTIGEQLRNEVRRRSGRPVVLAQNGVDLKAFQPVEPNPEWVQRWNPGKGILVSYVGSFHEYEGLEHLVDAIAIVQREHPDVRALIVGDGPNRASLQRRAARLGLEDAVAFPGRVAHEQVREIYATATLFVYPRVDSLTTRLTTPLKPLEAMAMARPVIASDLPALRELIQEGETGLLFKPGDAADLAARIGSLIDQPDLRESLAVNGRKYVLGQRDWNVSLRAYLPLYKSLLG